MVRPAHVNLWLVGAFVGLVAAGFALGWLVVPTSIPPGSGEPPSAILANHEFPLRPADRHHDRETPALAIDGQGRIALAWASQTNEGEFTIFLARSTDHGATFTGPAAFRTVRTHRFTVPGRDGKAMTFSTQVQPRLTASGAALDLGWVESQDGGPSVAFLVARSTDGGLSFSRPERVHGNAAKRPGFTALAVGSDGTVACAWLDGRHHAQQPFASTAVGAGSIHEQQVYAGHEDKGVCPCCDLAIAQAADATFVAFRNSEHGKRDIVVCRSTESGFSPPVPVTGDTWELQGCPHDGPSLACSADRLYATWTSGHTGQRRVYLAASPLDRLSFSPLPLPEASARERGHPRLAHAGDSHLVAVWDENLSDGVPPLPAGHEQRHGLHLTGSGRVITLTHSLDGGNTFSPPRTLVPREGVFQVQPAVCICGDREAVVAWNEITDNGKKVVVARVVLPAVQPLLSHR